MKNNHISYITSGTIVTNTKLPIEERLKNIFVNINQLIETHLKTKGIMNSGKILLGESSVKNLQTVYNEVIPLVVNLLKDMKVA